MLTHVADGQAKETGQHVVRQFASYILITVGVFSLWQAGIGTAAWIGCAKGAGFKACDAPAKAAQETLSGLITMGLGLMYQNKEGE